jgi:hypothetical protein
MAATPNLLYAYDFIKRGSNGDSVDDLPTTGGTPSVEGSDVGDKYGDLFGLAVDAAAGVYFVTAINGDNSYIYEQQFGQTAFSTAPVGGAPVATSLDDQVSSLPATTFSITRRGPASTKRNSPARISPGRRRKSSSPPCRPRRRAPTTSSSSIRRTTAPISPRRTDTSPSRRTLRVRRKSPSAA